MLPVSFPNSWPEEMTFPATEQVSLYFSMSCLLQARARRDHGCERGSRGTARDAGRERRIYSASPKSQPLGFRRLPSAPQTKCGESHFCFIRLAAWRKMIKSRCTHVLMWKEFGLLCQPYGEWPARGSISALFNLLQVLGSNIQWCSRAENQHVGVWRGVTPWVSRRARRRRYDLQVHPTAGNKAPSCKDLHPW